MGKLFGVVLVAAPLLAFAIWAYLHQTQLVETRMDVHEIQQQIDRDKFDLDFAEAFGKEPDPELKARIKENEAKLAEAVRRKIEARGSLDEATTIVDDELKAYDKEQSGNSE